MVLAFKEKQKLNLFKPNKKTENLRSIYLLYFKLQKLNLVLLKLQTLFRTNYRL